MNNIELRRHRVPRYVTIPPTLLLDKRLSFKAIGLYCKVMALPDRKKDGTPYDFSVNGLVAICKEGRDAVYSGLRELKENGWLITYQEKGEGGKFGCTVYDFQPECLPESMTALTDMSETDEPLTGFPDTVSPNTDNPTQNKNIIKSNLELNKTSSSSRVREGFVSKGNMPEMEQGWMDELRMFIRRFKQIELTEIQVMRHYLDFEAQMKAQWTDEHYELLAEWRQHFSNYLRKTIEIEGKTSGKSEGTVVPTIKGNYNASVEATNKMLEEKKKGTMSYQEYQQLKQKNNGKI